MKIRANLFDTIPAKKCNFFLFFIFIYDNFVS